MGMKMPRILVAMSADTYDRVISDHVRERLKELGEVTLCLDSRGMEADERNAMWAGADYCLSGWGVRSPDPDALGSPPRLKAICHSAGSVRMFPRALLERGIVVTSARSAIARTVGEFALLCTLTLLRRLDDVRSAKPTRPTSRTLYDKTVALIGCGCVGRHFRELLRPFGCRVLVVDPFLATDKAAELNVEIVGLEEALTMADVISLHAPDVPETRGLLGERELRTIRDGVVLVNTARGRLIDTEALTREMATGRLAAALDVTDPEPLPSDHPLRTMPNVMLTPHVAGPTTDELPRLGEAALADLERIMRGDAPAHPISLEAYDRMSF
jgi:phosphoglycerate dehydrogenase-like enzyme